MVQYDIFVYNVSTEFTSQIILMNSQSGPLVIASSTELFLNGRAWKTYGACENKSYWAWGVIYNWRKLSGDKHFNRNYSWMEWSTGTFIHVSDLLSQGNNLSVAADTSIMVTRLMVPCHNGATALRFDICESHDFFLFVWSEETNEIYRI